MKRISRLPEDVVHRIAAGEVVQRPANALKELVENSLDAGARSVRVTVKAGGLKFIQIQDDGCGVHRDDLAALCERFATSKLRGFDDLRTIATYGFRGEALASVSHVAHLAVTTRTADDDCAYKLSYKDGAPLRPPVPCAANRGTTLTVEDLFYNVAARKRALKSPAEEYQRIFRVVADYAVHNSAVGFQLGKHGENVDLITPPNSNCLDNIRTVFGNNVARDLMNVSVEDDALRVKAHGYVSNLNYSAKKGILLLFINHRSVESSSLKKAIDTVYGTYLPKNGHSFVYLSLEIDSRNVDVNVHPTKHEVHFLHEEEIIDKIKIMIETKLLSCHASRVLYVQSKLPGSSSPELADLENKSTKDNKFVYAKNLVRTDASEQKIDKFFSTHLSESENSIRDISTIDPKVEIETPYQNTEDISVTQQDAGTFQNESTSPKPNTSYTNVTNTSSNLSYVNPCESFKTRKFSVDRNETQLTSVKSLRMHIEEKCDMALREILANHVFIGCVDESKALIQHSTKMYLCNSSRIMEELFYEILLYDFQNFGFIKLTPPLPIYELAMLALNSPESGWTYEDGEKGDLAEKVKKLLVGKGNMLLEYFSMEVDDDGNLISLPLLLDNYMPFLGALPMYVLRLATEIDWQTEKECFRTFCRETARFYSQQNPSSEDKTVKNRDWTQEHVVYCAVRKYFLPPREFAKNGAILQVANLPDLYKVFERC